jgi:hypothetical protein
MQKETDDSRLKVSQFVVELCLAKHDPENFVPDSTPGVNDKNFVYPPQQQHHNK